MKFLSKPEKQLWASLTKRPEIETENLDAVVNEIFKQVKNYGDSALLNYTKQFDNVEPHSIAIFTQSAYNISEDLKQAIQLAMRNIERFHAAQCETPTIIETAPGVKCWRESRPIERVGLYIPGGSAPLFSTILMLAIPAKIAGCKEIVLCTPPNKNGEINDVILYTANQLGIEKIYAVGGIQAIAALTFGTQTISKVDKIFGPGNQYVTAAKKAAQQLGIAIDMPAGPSELLVIADHSCVPEFVAADLLSQAEHGIDSQVVLLTNSENLIKQITQEISCQLHQLPRKEIAMQALKNSKAILLDNIESCVAFSNLYAPEHLILAIENPKQWLPKIENAGSVFLGNYSCESAGDYASGTNHTLPTNGFARNYSGVSLDSFVKKITVQQLSEVGINSIGKAIEQMAEAENLMAHKNAVSIRLKNISND